MPAMCRGGDDRRRTTRGEPVMRMKPNGGHAGRIKTQK
jgi:hypothetical protein